ncbi:MAG: hypothetical protein O2913_08815 [Chloroflexi bacterium]|nr:hypothetical protein [Chloroflexota bacterium]
MTHWFDRGQELMSLVQGYTGIGKGDKKEGFMAGENQEETRMAGLKGVARRPRSLGVVPV